MLKIIWLLLKKDGFKAVPASDLFPQGAVKHDSAELVNTLRRNNIDLLLTNAVISRTENERFIPGAVQGKYCGSCRRFITPDYAITALFWIQ